MNHAIKIHKKSSQKATKGRRPKPPVKHMHQKGIKFTHNTSYIQKIQIEGIKMMDIGQTWLESLIEIELHPWGLQNNL